MLRLWLGDVGECEGSGMCRTEWGVGMGSVETDMPRSEAEGRFGTGEAFVEGPLEDWGLGCFSFCLLEAPLLAIVCRIVRCGVLEVREGGGEAFGEGCDTAVTMGLLLGFRYDVACHGDTEGGAGCGFSMGVPSCCACCNRFRSFCDILGGAVFDNRSFSPRERPKVRFEVVVVEVWAMISLRSSFELASGVVPHGWPGALVGWSTGGGKAGTELIGISSPLSKPGGEV